MLLRRSARHALHVCYLYVLHVHNNSDFLHWIVCLCVCIIVAVPLALAYCSDKAKAPHKAQVQIAKYKVKNYGKWLLTIAACIWALQRLCSNKPHLCFHSMVSICQSMHKRFPVIWLSFKFGSTTSHLLAIQSIYHLAFPRNLRLGSMTRLYLGNNKYRVYVCVCAVQAVARTTNVSMYAHTTRPPLHSYACAAGSFLSVAVARKSILHSALSIHIYFISKQLNMIWKVSRQAVRRINYLYGRLRRCCVYAFVLALS